MTTIAASRRYHEIVTLIKDLLARLLGRSEEDIPVNVSFLDIGADSLFLLQTNRVSLARIQMRELMVPLSKVFPARKYPFTGWSPDLPAARGGSTWGSRRDLTYG